VKTESTLHILVTGGAGVIGSLANIEPFLENPRFQFNEADGTWGHCGAFECRF